MLLTHSRKDIHDYLRPTKISEDDDHDLPDNFDLHVSKHKKIKNSKILIRNHLVQFDLSDDILDESK